MSASSITIHHKAHERPQRITSAPPKKKMKLNTNKVVDVSGKQPDGDLLIDEQAFIQQNGGPQSIHKIKIIVPKDKRWKQQFNFNGQTLTIAMELNQTITQLKQQINDELKLPINKQKLRCKANGIWVKNSKSLAFYNIKEDSILDLMYRRCTRGGTKKKRLAREERLKLAKKGSDRKKKTVKETINAKK